MEGTLFFSRINTLSEFCDNLGLPFRIAPQYKQNGELLALWLRMWHFRQYCFRLSISAGSVKSLYYIVCLPTSQDSSFYVFIFLLSSEIFFVCFWGVNVNVNFAQLSPAKSYLRLLRAESTEWIWPNYADCWCWPATASV